MFPMASCARFPAVISHPQLVNRGRWISAKNQAGKTFEALLPPFLKTAASLGVRKVPALGEHTKEVLG